ncbi:hypothetical protein L798_15195 [Zootermopsis nevadensis]|uniref:Uncharacterized protein n=1 Tax=Zootermopsis nevadensis TaxID=136037 RepID=A0A067RJF8_ZOONE|nr:hypothetical protein L798_15195 [Zootermopsis nevadensis]
MNACRLLWRRRVGERIPDPILESFVGARRGKGVLALRLLEESGGSGPHRASLNSVRGTRFLVLYPSRNRISLECEARRELLWRSSAVVTQQTDTKGGVKLSVAP